MFNQSADAPAADQPDAPVGMRELPPQPARPVMPAYTLPSTPTAPRVEELSGPGADDSVIARDDHFDGTFTSRGTVVVMGSVKGRIEAVRVRIEAGAHVDADVIVDEAIVAGEFTGNLTCRERLEARSSGRINGRVETYKLMLHEGASVEGEMHMLTERPRDASETIRGSAPLRGEGKGSGRPETPAPLAPASPASPAAPTSAPTSAPSGGSATAVSSAASPTAPSVRPAPVVMPSSSAKAGRSASSGAPAPRPAQESTPASAPSTPRASTVPSVESILAQRSPVAQTLRLDGPPLVAPRTTSSARTGGAASGTATGSANGSRSRTATTGF